VYTTPKSTLSFCRETRLLTYYLRLENVTLKYYKPVKQPYRTANWQLNVAKYFSICQPSMPNIGTTAKFSLENNIHNYSKADNPQTE